MFSQSTLVWALATCTGFAMFCTAMHIPQIEYDLTMRSDAALSSQGLREVAVAFDGRDAVMTGRAPGEAAKAQAEQTVAGLYGVRAVHNRIEIEEREQEAGLAGLQLEIDELLRESRIEFETASVQLTAAGRKVVDQAALLLRKDAAATAEITGHTDNQGSRLANVALSRRRAEAVVQRLVEQGIDAGRLSARGYGDSRPIADNRTQQGRVKNRRVEITLLSAK